jgi:putative transposase
MTRQIEAHRDRLGVEPICRVLQFAPAAYYAAATRPPSGRKVSDEELKLEISPVWSESRRVCGADKVWTQLNRQGIWVARCAVERLMRAIHCAHMAPWK